MVRYSPESYAKMFDALLEQELCYSSSFASEANIYAAIKRVLGAAIKTNCILIYSDLIVDSLMNVHFTILDPDKDFVQITLFYGQ